MGRIINALEKETHRKCFASFRRQLDREQASVVEYDDFQHQFMSQQGETIRYGGPRDVSYIARQWLPRAPVFAYFLDGSRRTYKIADIPIGTQFFPLIAGQVGVGVCRRDNKRLSACKLSLHTVLALPRKLDTEGKNEKQCRAFFLNLKQKLNEWQAGPGIRGFVLDELLFYKTEANDNFEDKGIARIHEYMVEREKAMVKTLVEENLLSDRTWLVKDGSLEYSRLADRNAPFVFSKIKSNYKRVVGVSKSFNPELARLSSNKSAAKMIADLKPFERTPAAMYSTDRVEGKFAVWYVRLREPRLSRGPFDGIVKVEKILTTASEEEYGLDSNDVDKISAWIVNERNPVCYGKDGRWANHLYPIYLTERFVKSKYRGTAHFINLF
jgi:hypothetical protein